MATWFSLANKIWVGVIRVTSGWKHFRARTWLLVLSPRLAVRWPKIQRCCAVIMWNTIPSAYTHDGHWTRPVISKHWVTPLRVFLFDRYTCITDKRIWSPCIIFNVIVDSVNSLLVFTTSLIFLRLIFFPCVCNLSDFDNIIHNNWWFVFYAPKKFKEHWECPVCKGCGLVMFFICFVESYIHICLSNYF